MLLNGGDGSATDSSVAAANRNRIELANRLRIAKCNELFGGQKNATRALSRTTYTNKATKLTPDHIKYADRLAAFTEASFSKSKTGRPPHSTIKATTYVNPDV